jgi:hypothetical protein
VKVLVDTALEAFEWEVVASSPSDYMVQVVERDTVAVHLDDSCWACTYCYCTREEAEE